MDPLLILPAELSSFIFQTYSILILLALRRVSKRWKTKLETLLEMKWVGFSISHLLDNHHFDSLEFASVPIDHDERVVPFEGRLQRIGNTKECEFFSCKDQPEGTFRPGDPPRPVLEYRVKSSDHLDSHESVLQMPLLYFKALDIGACKLIWRVRLEMAYSDECEKFWTRPLSMKLKPWSGQFVQLPVFCLKESCGKYKFYFSSWEWIGKIKSIYFGYCKSDQLDAQTNCCSMDTLCWFNEDGQYGHQGKLEVEYIKTPKFKMTAPVLVYCRYGYGVIYRVAFSGTDGNLYTTPAAGVHLPV